MAVRYVTVTRKAQAEQVIERSRFIAHITPVRTREEAEAFIDEIRADYRDATHNVPALVVGEKMQVQWASDDGEPSGTSGAPMLHFLVNKGITNTAIVVTRYFGGIKLGTGGLVRAYTSSAALALEAAGIHEVRDIREVCVRIDYSLLGRLQSLEKTMPFTINDTVYKEVVEIKLEYEPEEEAQMAEMLAGISSGKVEYIYKRDFIR